MPPADVPTPDAQPPDPRYRTVDVPVRGGELRVGVWEPAGIDTTEAPTVLLIHGLTASHRAWVAVTRGLPEFRVVAPDLRGRGRSNELPEPYGMVQHADDVAAVLEFLQIPRAVVVGHSMGGFVALVFADRHPDRTQSLLLVDGGVPLPEPPDGITADDVAKALGPAAERLSMTFPDRQAYQQFFQAHPAFVGAWSDAAADYVDYDLVGDPPVLRSSTPAAAMLADSIDQYGNPHILAAMDRLVTPTPFLRAPKGFVNDPPGIYPPQWLAYSQQRWPALSVSDVPGVNHYTILFSDPGVDAVAGAVREAAGR